MKSTGKYFIIRGWPHWLVQTPTVGISGYNNVKSGGPKFVFERNPDQFQWEPDGKCDVIGTWDLGYKGTSTSWLLLNSHAWVFGLLSQKRKEKEERVYSIDSSRTISIPPEVSNFNSLFLKRNRFICNKPPDLPGHSLELSCTCICMPGSSWKARFSLLKYQKLIPVYDTEVYCITRTFVTQTRQKL